METTTVYTLKYKGQQLELAESKVKDFVPEYVQAWEFQHRDYTGDAAIKVGVKMSDARVGAAFGTDGEVIAVAKGKFIAEEIATSPANAGSLPAIVLKQFGRRIERGIYPTEEEMEALKVPTKASSEDTTTVEA